MFSYNMLKFNPNIKQGYADGWQIANLLAADRLADCMLKYCWSPIIWNKSYRKQSNFKSAHWLALDFDNNVGLTLEEAQRSFCDMIHVIGTTKSHQKLKQGVICDRFRVALLFEQPITDLRIFRWNMKKAVLKYEADPLCVDGARMYYPCHDIVTYSTEGELYEIDTNVDNHFDCHIDLSEYRLANVMPSWLIGKLTSPFPQGRKTITCYAIAKDLFKLGFDEKRIISFILNSPSYKDGVQEDTRKKIHQAIQSGIRSAHVEMTLIDK